MTLRTQEGTVEATISGTLVAVTKKLPYEGWEQFTPLVEECVRAYAEVYPSTVLRSAAVHYENLIVLPSSQDVTSFIPALGIAIASSPFHFQSGFFSANYTDEEGGSVSVNAVRYTEREGKQVLVNLTLHSYGPEFPDETPLLSYRQPIDVAREHATRQFEAMISDDARSLLGLRDGS